MKKESDYSKQIYNFGEATAEEQQEVLEKLSSTAVSYPHLDVYKRQVLGERVCRRGGPGSAGSGLHGMGNAPGYGNVQS